MAQLNEDELIEVGLASLADIFGLSPKELTQNLVAARAINWAHDPFARGGYRCTECDGIDPLQSFIARAWIESQLKPPK